MEVTRQVAVGIEGVKSHCHTVVILGEIRWQYQRLIEADESKRKIDLRAYLRLICFREDGGRRTLDDRYRSARRVTAAVEDKSSRGCVLFEPNVSFTD